jgi:hypothetical protein
MTEAALIEDSNMPPHDFELEAETETLTESAPVKQEVTPVEQVEQTEEEIMSERAQKRFNKITAEKYAEKQRADELQRKLDERQAQPEEVSDAPTLEKFDYDDAAYQAALIKHQVAEAVKAERAAQQNQTVQAQAAEAQRAYNERVAALNKPDFYEVANAIPQLPSGVANALTESDNGPDLIYHLGTHLDLADKIANMSPTQAVMELGKISANLNAKPNIKLSAAPEPIAPISSGSSLNKDISEMTMEEIYGL